MQFLLNNCVIKVSSLSEKALFFRQWLKTPLKLGAVAPSSKALSAFVAKCLLEDSQNFLDNGEIIVEIGAGTGAFTEALLKAGLPKHQLIAIEMDPYLCAYLKKRLPGIKILCGDAQNLPGLLEKRNNKGIGAILSGIPMISIPETVRTTIVRSAFHVLPKSGKFYQFTYSPFSSIPIKHLQLKKKRRGTILMNLPPATLWSYQRAA